MYFDPQPIRYPYPEETDKHYLHVKKNKGIVFDEKYPYVDNSFGFKFKRFWIRFLLVLIVFPLDRIRLGLKIKGRKNLKKYKDVIKQGVVSISNHIHMWDYITLHRLVYPIKPNVLSWAPNINGENGTLIRMTGGIPIPEKSFRGTVAYYKAVEKLLTIDGGWLHIYPEGSMWEYYAPIRPFKRGAAFFAVKFNKPIIPIGYSYRKPTWWRKVFFKQLGRITANVGEPIYPNLDIADLNEREKDLLIRSHQKVCELADIKPEENKYPPIFDNSKRVDYYSDKYGVGYKGSW